MMYLGVDHSKTPPVDWSIFQGWFATTVLYQFFSTLATSLTVPIIQVIC